MTVLSLQVHSTNTYDTHVFSYVHRSQKVLIQPALNLLNSHGAHFDAAQVLELLPHDWPIVTVKAFLLRSVRGGMDASHTAKIEYNLAKGENIQVRTCKCRLQCAIFVLTCAVELLY